MRRAAEPLAHARSHREQEIGADGLPSRSFSEGWSGALQGNGAGSLSVPDPFSRESAKHVKILERCRELFRKAFRRQFPFASLTGAGSLDLDSTPAIIGQKAKKSVERVKTSRWRSSS